MNGEVWCDTRKKKTTTASKRTAFTNWVMSFHTGNATNAQTIHTLHIRISYGGAFELFLFCFGYKGKNVLKTHMKEKNTKSTKYVLHRTALIDHFEAFTDAVTFLVLIRTQFSIVREFLCQRAIIFREH